MAEYIKREVALDAITNLAGKAPTCSAYEIAWKSARALKKIPAADAASVVRGRWEEADWVELDGGGNELIRTPNAALRCSICRNCFKKELLWKGTYCPSCGAKMDGGDNDATD